MKIKIDLYDKGIVKLNESDFKNYKEGGDVIKSKIGVVYDCEEYLVIEIKKEYYEKD